MKKETQTTLHNILYNEYIPNSQIWASKKRKMSRAETNMAGYYDAEIVPYLNDIANACESGLYSMVVIVMGSQMSKTEFLLNRAGYVISRDPVPIALAFPTQDLVKRFSKKRLEKMILNTPTLACTFDKEKSTYTDKYVGGGSIRLIWCTSAVQVSSDPLKEAYIDELDRCAEDVGGEGDPVTLLKARGSTYPDFLLVTSSTPTIEGNSPIVSWWEKGTKMRFHWCCPNCSQNFYPCSTLLRYPDKTPEQAWVECPNCNYKITNELKEELNKTGGFISEYNKDQLSQFRVASYWINGLCSPWKSFADRATELYQAELSGDQNIIKGVINTSFGETYILKGEAPDYLAVYSCIQDYDKIDLENKIHFVFATVDVQANRLYFVIRGWGDNFNSWLLLYGEFFGDTSTISTFQEFEKQVLGTNECQRLFYGLPVTQVLIDCGFREAVVFDFCRSNLSRFQPVKGNKQIVPIRPNRIEYGIKKYPMQLWLINDSYFKEMLYQNIRAEQYQKKWFVNKVTEDYAKSVTAEEMIVQPDGKKEWILKHHRNDYLDCEKYMLALAHIMGLHICNMNPKENKEKGNRKLLSGGI